jgi:hypothetical protein
MGATQLFSTTTAPYVGLNRGRAASAITGTGIPMMPAPRAHDQGEAGIRERREPNNRKQLSRRSGQSAGEIADTHVR